MFFAVRPILWATGARTCSHVPNVVLVAVAKIVCYNGAVLEGMNFEIPDQPLDEELVCQSLLYM